jgi:hypothetical protein
VIVFCALLFLAYTSYLPAYWNFNRYLYPFILPLVLALGLIIDTYDRRLTSRTARALLVGGVALVLVGGNLASPELHSLYTSTDTTTRGYVNLGRWAAGRFAPGTVVGSSQSGALGYFADSLTVVNLDGVVNSDCYRSIVERRNIEYIHAAGVAYVVGWDSDINFIVRNSVNIGRDDLVLEGTIPGFMSWGKQWYVMRVGAHH